MAQQAVATFAILAFFREEAPIDGDSPWVSADGLDHTPNQEEEQNQEDDQENNVGGWSDPQHVLYYKDVEVESDETADPDEVRIAESS